MSTVPFLYKLSHLIPELSSFFCILVAFDNIILSQMQISHSASLAIPRIPTGANVRIASVLYEITAVLPHCPYVSQNTSCIHRVCRVAFHRIAQYHTLLSPLDSNGGNHFPKKPGEAITAMLQAMQNTLTVVVIEQIEQLAADG